MGRTMGLEPTASGATNQRSNQLSYVRHNFLKTYKIVTDTQSFVIRKDCTCA